MEDGSGGFPAVGFLGTTRIHRQPTNVNRIPHPRVVDLRRDGVCDRGRFTVLFVPCSLVPRVARIELVQLGAQRANRNAGQFTVRQCQSDIILTANRGPNVRIRMLLVTRTLEPIKMKPVVGADVVAIAVKF